MMEAGYDHIEAKACMDFNNAVYDDYRGVWCEAPEHDNFRAALDVDEQGAYYLCIRGTDPTKLKDLIVDIKVFQKMHFPIEMPTGIYKPHISRGLTVMFEALAPKIEQRLNDLADGTDLYVTGHSQGGAAAPLFALWIEVIFPGKFNIKSYAFAPPTIGNRDFNTVVQQHIPLGVFRVVNPCDTVPHFYIDIKTLVRSNIPKRIPILLKFVYFTMHVILKCRGLVYAHTGETVVLAKSQPDDGGFSFIPFKRYTILVLGHHAGTHYSTLLDY